MFISSDIRKMTLAFEKTFQRQVFSALGQAGILHLARLQEKDTDSEDGLQKEEALTREILSATTRILNALNLEPDNTEKPVRLVHAGEDEAFVSKTIKILERSARIQAKIREAQNTLARDLQHAEALNKMGMDPVWFQKPGILKTVFGTVKEQKIQTPENSRFLLVEMHPYVLGIAMPSDYPEMIRILQENGFEDQSEEVRPNPPAILEKRNHTLSLRSAMIESYINRLKEREGQTLLQIHRDYRIYEKMLSAMRLSINSSRAAFLTGWMDIQDKEKLIGIMQSICQNRFLLKITKDPEAPVRLRNIRIFKPFELLVNIMGTPSSNELDPTPVAALTYVIMFGLMFGDLGQGLVLMLAGLFLKRSGQKKAQQFFGQAGEILLACGASAAVCGLLYGSVFSSEHLLPAIWFHPTEDILRLFSLTILMGAILIIIGFSLNIINGCLNGDYFGALLEKRGLAVGILYATVVASVFYHQQTGQPPSLWLIAPAVCLPLLAFSMKSLLGQAFFQKARPQHLAEYVVETFMEIVEIVLGLFANTISFIRVGAFALSHAGLSMVTYTLAGMADPARTSVGAVIIIVIGNIFIMGFEGLICGIQSLRLEYYEFFSRFFKGEGIPFSPFTLEAKTLEV